MKIKELVIGAAIMMMALSEPSLAAKCEDVGRIVGVQSWPHTTVITTESGSFNFNSNMAVNPSRSGSHLCYNSTTNELCFPTGWGDKPVCKVVE